MKPIEHLKQLDIEQKKRNYPNFPYPVATNYKANSANELTKSIKALINLTGGYAFRVNVGGIFDEKKHKFRTTGATKGVSDLIACYKGRFVGIEIKYHRDKQSENQKKWQQHIENSGGVYVIARDFDTLYNYWMDMVNNEELPF